jgi:hypothetical protein
LTADEVHQAAATATRLVKAVERLLQSLDCFPLCPPDFRDQLEHLRRGLAAIIALPVHRLAPSYDAQAVGQRIGAFVGSNSLEITRRLADELLLDVNTVLAETWDILTALGATVDVESDDFHRELYDRLRLQVESHRGRYPRLDEIGLFRAAIKQETARVLETLGTQPRRQRKGKPPGDNDGPKLVPGGFEYKGKAHDLTGRPRDMLAALLESRHRRCAVSDLRRSLGVDDEAVEWPEQVIKDTAKELRAALRAAASGADVACGNPLPSTGKGRDLTYKLDMP